MAKTAKEGILNWALLGTGRINRALIPAVRESKRSFLLGAASRSLDRAEYYAKEWKIPRAYGSYEDMLADPEIHVVYNSLPNNLHAPWTIKAAQAGKHVLCEKPLALSVEEVDQIIQAARDNHVIVAEAFMYQHHPETRWVREMVSSGELGKVGLVKGSFTFPLERPEDIRWKPDLGGGSIWDVGCYPISYSMMIAGEAPVEVEGWQVASPTGVDLTFAGQMRFSDGMIAQFDSSFGLSNRMWMEIHGTDGLLLLPSPFKPNPKEKLVLQKDGEKRSISVSGPYLYVGEVDDIASAVLDGKPQLLTLEQSRLHIAVIRSLLESAKNGGKPVTL